jgi:pimeloyl-ACP methyl ester carboxylesterase
LFDWFPPRHVGALASWVWNDPIALGVAFAALYGKGQPPVDKGRLGEIRVPVLTVVGTRDGFCRSNRQLAEHISGSRRVTISGRNHASTIGDRRFKAAVAEFLQSVDGARWPGKLPADGE